MKEQPTPVLKHYEGDHLDLETRERMLNTLLLAFGTRFTGTVPAIDQLTWKLEDPPGLPSVAVLGELDGQVVITETNLRRRFRIHGETQPVREGADSSTHPDYQGRGFSRPRQAYTNAHVKPAFALTFSLFTNPIAIHTNARLDAQRLGNGIRTFTYQQHPFRIFRGSGVMGLLRAPARSARTIALTVLQRVRHRQKRLQNVTWKVVTAERFDERVNAFFDEAARPFEFIQVRDENFLNWRYTDPRSGDSTIRIAEEQGTILGYAVLHVRQDRGHIMDLLTLPGRLDVVQSLVTDGLEQFRASGVESVHCWMATSHPYNDVLKGLGFVVSRDTVTLTYQPLRMDADTLAFLGDQHTPIHFMHGDSDWI